MSLKYCKLTVFTVIFSFLPVFLSRISPKAQYDQRVVYLYLAVLFVYSLTWFIEPKLHTSSVEDWKYYIIGSVSSVIGITMLAFSYVSLRNHNKHHKSITLAPFYCCVLFWVTTALYGVYYPDVLFNLNILYHSAVMVRY